MNNILDAIKALPEQFIDAARGRATTTPSERNRVNHIKIANAIEAQDWETVKEVLMDGSYNQRALGGVVYCLDYYNTVPSDLLIVITRLYENDQLV